MWSRLVKVTAGAKSDEILIFRKYANLMQEDTEQCESGDCDCEKKIGVLFVLYRIVMILSYLLLLGGLWQLEVVLRKTIRNRCKHCQSKTTVVSNKGCKNCTFTGRKRIFSHQGNVSITEEIDYHVDLLDSSGDTIDGNIHFVTYREEVAEVDGFQDDDYNDILASSQLVNDDLLELEELLQQQDIDWDSPVPMALTPSSNETFHEDYIDTYFDEDFISILGVAEQKEFELLNIDEFLENSNRLPNLSHSFSSLTAPLHRFESIRDILDDQMNNYASLDDDVIAAIVGKSNLEELLPSTLEIVNECDSMYL